MIVVVSNLHKCKQSQHTYIIYSLQMEIPVQIPVLQQSKEINKTWIY